MIDTNTYKKRLEANLTNIIGELKTLGEHNPITDDWVPTLGEHSKSEPDTNIEADVLEEGEVRESTLTALEIEYRDIKRALHKIEVGTFGVCEISGEVIEEDRLDFKPTARTCKAHMGEEGQLPL